MCEAELCGREQSAPSLPEIPSSCPSGLDTRQSVKWRYEGFLGEAEEEGTRNQIQVDVLSSWLLPFFNHKAIFKVSRFPEEK